MPRSTKKFLKNFHNLYIPIYGANLLFTTDRAAFDKLLVDNGSKPSDPECSGIQCCLTRKSDNVVIYLIGIFRLDLGDLVHECAHAVFELFGDRGVEVSEGEANEAFCYMIQFLFDELSPLVRKKNAKAKG